MMKVNIHCKLQKATQTQGLCMKCAPSVSYTRTVDSSLVSAEGASPPPHIILLKCHSLQIRGFLNRE